VRAGGRGCSDSVARRAFLTGLLAVVAAACAGPTSEAARRRERDLVAQGRAAMGMVPIVDLHAHPGEFFRDDLAVAAVDAIHDAGVASAFFCAIGDAPVIRRFSEGKTFFQYLDYVRQLAGVEHVGVGTDMMGMSVYTSIPSYRQFAPVPAALLARGYAESDLRALLAGNRVRVLESVARA